MTQKMNELIDELIEELLRRGSEESEVEDEAAELIKWFGSAHDALLWLELVAVERQVRDPAVRWEMIQKIFDRAKGTAVKSTYEGLHWDDIAISREPA